MNIRLSDFEQQIDPVIRKRGYEYFRKGYVTEVEDLGCGDYEATVEGSDIYTVGLHIDGDEVTGYECDCPYDWGSVCKHIAAVLFYLKNDLTGKDVHSRKEKQVKPEKESEAVQFEKLLDTITTEELKMFFRDLCSNDKRIRRLFIAKHISLLYPESKELYDVQVKKLLKTYTDRYGIIGYYEASRLCADVNEMVDKARQCMEAGEIQKALYMTEAIVEGLYEAIGIADDSSGAIGECMEGAFEVLADLANTDMDEMLHNEMFDWLLRHFETKTMYGWDWHTYLIQIAIIMVKTEDEKRRIMDDLDRIKPNGRDWDWDYMSAQNLKLQLIRRTEDEDAAIRFMEANKDNHNFRKELIERAVAEKDYVKAERLASEGMKKDKKNAPGLANDWQDYLLQIYQATRNTAKVTDLARNFFVQGSNRHHSLDYYYKLLKSLIPQAQWQQYVENLIADINRMFRFGDNYSRVAEIYIWEKEWDKLFELLKNSPDFCRIEGAEKYLAGKYSEELAAMYRRLILDYMPGHIGRDHYQMVCKYIRRMIKLGQKPMALELVEQLEAQYRNRRALREELAYIF